MILIIHLLVGAAIATNINFLPLALLLCFLSHYLLDALPHNDPTLKKIKEKNWRNSFKDFLTILVDFSLGILLIFLFSKNFSLALVGALIATLPDIFTFLNLISPNKVFGRIQDFHIKIHFPNDKKISFFWKLFSQTSVIAIAIFFLLQL